MNQESLIFEARARPAWQAVDVGCLIARQHFFQLLGCWCVTAIPIAAILGLVYWFGDRGEGGWQFFLFWLFKPFYERAQLFYLSRKVFGEKVRYRDIFFHNAKVLLRGLPMDLTLRRLSPARSTNLPVTMLEGQGGSRRTKRLQILHRNQTGPSFPLLLLLVHLEVFLLFSIGLVLALMIPQGLFEDLPVMEILSADAYATQLFYISFALTFAAAAIVAPFYVAGGFILYLNRRIHLEGWDLQLIFPPQTVGGDRSNAATVEDGAAAREQGTLAEAQS